MKNTLSSTVLASALCACVASLNANPIAYEGFDYTSGVDVVGQNGGSGWGGTSWSQTSGTETYNVSPPLSAFTDGVGNTLVETGGTIVEDAQTGSSSNIRRQYDLGSSGFGSDGTEGWISYRANISGSGSHGFQWGPSGGNLTQLQFYRVNGGGASNTWQLQIGGSTINRLDTDPDQISATGDFLIILKVDYQSGADPTSVWVVENGTGNISSEASLGTPYLSLSTNGVGANDTVSFYSGNFPTSVTYDEFRVGMSFGDVVPVPEPGSYALIAGFLALGSIMLRRRK